MVRCLFIFSNFPNTIENDSGDWMVGFITSLRGRGIIPYVLCPHTPNSKHLEIIHGITIYRYSYFIPFKFEIIADGNGGIPQKISDNPFILFQAPFLMLSALFSACKIIKREKIQIINTHWLIPQGFLGSIISKIMNLPHVSTLHSSEITLLKKIPLNKIIGDILINGTNSIVSVSKHRLIEFESILSKHSRLQLTQKVHVIPMGVNIPESNRIFHTSNIASEIVSDNKQFIILFVGRLIRLKGIIYAIQAIEEVQYSIPNIKMQIIGRGPEITHLRDYVNKKGLSDRIEFLGYIQHRYLLDYYRNADVIIIPSIVDSSGYQEGLPVVLLEALAAKKIVIGTKISGIMEVITDNFNGILVDQKDSSMICNKIQQIYADPSKRKLMEENAFKSSFDYNWKTVSQKYFDIIINEVKGS